MAKKKHGLLWNLFHSSTPTKKTTTKYKGIGDPEEFLNNMFPERKQQTLYLDEQNKMLARLASANTEYKADGNLDKLIAVYEDVFINADPYLKSSQEIDLADLYIKAGQNDKAWGFLNLLIQRNETPLHRIYAQQVRILKKEGRHVDAVRTYMFCYLDKAQVSNSFNSAAFQKDIQPSVNKLKWDQQMVSDLTTIMSEQISAHNFSTRAIITRFDHALEEYQARKS